MLECSWVDGFTEEPIQELLNLRVQAVLIYLNKALKSYNREYRNPKVV